MVIRARFGERASESYSTCQCVLERAQKARQIQLTGNSGLKQKYRHCTFELWDTLEGAIQDGKRTARGYCERFTKWDFTGNDPARQPESYGIVLSGSKGLGKSGLMASVANRLLASNRPVLWINWRELVKRVRATYSHDPAKPSYDQVIDTLNNAAVLMIDDMGDSDSWGAVTDNRREIAQDVLTPRYDDMRPTLITTNLNYDSFQDKFGELLSQRARELYAWIVVKGALVRSQNAPIEDES